MKRIQSRKCPQCKSELEKAIFDVGYGVKVESLHCSKCGFNITRGDKLKRALASLKEQMARRSRLLKLGLD